ncbi:MAG: pantetheine-phosphate adenylyltransferase [Bacilli bacterium]
MRVAVYPGSFCPLTNGHIDIIKRACKVFDKVIILVAVNKDKKYSISVNDRVKLIKEATIDMDNVSVDSYDGLTMNYARNVHAVALIRGLRVVSDFEYEWQYAAANEYIDSNIEIVFFMAHKETNFISSSTINELFNSGVDISPLVPKCVLDYLNKNRK